MTRHTILFAGLAFALGGCAIEPGHNGHGEHSQADATIQEPPVVGGYATASGEEPGYAEAEALAIATIYKREPQRGLVESKSAQVQVVAGLNFRFDIKMSGENRYTVVVYRDLKGALEVTSFTKTGG